MHTFIDDDLGYLAWIDAHPEGFVVNAPRYGGTVPLVLHSARCRFISSGARTNYTTTAYYKMCDEDRGVLVGWLDARTGHWQACGKCASLMDEAKAHIRLNQAAPPKTSGLRALAADMIESNMPLPPTTLSHDPESWALWAEGGRTHHLRRLEPHLASWNAGNDPAQVRLRVYLEAVARDLGPLPETASPLFLHLDVDVGKPERLLRHYDLENYLTPLIARLGPQRFSLVSATKRVGGGSELFLGWAVPLASSPNGWQHFSHNTTGSASTPQWKADLRAALKESGAGQAPPGPMAVQLAWRCPARRNWVSFWKPTGDAMGPVLGEPDSRHPFNPADDRIVAIHMHRCIAESAGNDVRVGMWWRAHQDGEGE